MKTTMCLATAIVILAGLTPLAHAVDPTAWNTKINGPGRFTVLAQFDKEAVFDKETGLVWERSPSTAFYNWYSAQVYCNNLPLGNRKGWRLPTIQELASLVDTTQRNPALPSGYPFQTVLSHFYWSATTAASNASFAYGVVFSSGDVGDGGKDSYGFIWCVRGRQGVDPQ
jgi:Protein of unknown function (DUF1566)